MVNLYLQMEGLSPRAKFFEELVNSWSGLTRRVRMLMRSPMKPRAISPYDVYMAAEPVNKLGITVGL
ncbi:MAG: hypothetical protein QXN23_02025 [Candidatus Caldarchaeum sp.]